jgi:hypothetical protein
VIRYLLIILAFWCSTAFAQVESSKPPPELIAEARELLRTDGDPLEAIAALNQILLLPPNEFSREAHELIISAYERAKKPLRAAAEIKAYLSMYPDSDVAKIVRERLLAIEIANPVKIRSTLESRQPKTDSASKFDASISEYLYSSSNTPNLLGWKQEQLTAITNVRTTGMYRSGDLETKVTVRDTKVFDLLVPARSKNTVQLANVQFLNTFIGYDVRLGRQYSQFGAVSRFDGATAKYDFGNGIRVGGAFGQPEMSGSSDPRKFFGFGGEYDSGSLISASAFYNEQSTRGFLERRAIGGDIRLSANGSSGMVIADYDLLYRSLNSILIQGLTTVKSYSLYVLVDRRRSPMLIGDRGLYLGTELPSRQAYTSIQELLANTVYSHSEIRSFIAATTPISTSYVLGVTKKLNNSWDASTNFQVSNISRVLDPLFVPTAEAPVSVIQQPGSGNLLSWNLQFYGQNVGNKSNNVNFLLSLTKDNTSTSRAITATDTERFSNLKLELTARAYFLDQQKVTRSEIVGSVRGNYRTSEKSSVEAQIGMARSTTYDKDAAFRSTRYNGTFFAGYRMDF